MTDAFSMDSEASCQGKFIGHKSIFPVFGACEPIEPLKCFLKASGPYPTKGFAINKHWKPVAGPPVFARSSAQRGPRRKITSHY